MAQTRTNKRTGEVQELQPDGSWKTIQPGMSLPSMSVQTKPADPRIPLQTQVLQGQAAASQYAAPKAAADTQSAQADARFAVQKAEAEARKAEADAKKAETEASSGNAKAATTVRADAIAGYQTAQQLYGLISDLNAKFQAGPGKTSGLAGGRDYLPMVVNQQFDKAGDAARGIVGQALGFTGGQLNTQREAEAAIGPYLPHASDRDEVIRDKIARLTELAKQAEARSISVLGGRPDANGNIIPVGNEQPESNAQLPQDRVQQATGGTRTEVDEFRKGVMTRVSQMVTQGRPRSEVEKYVRDNGLELKPQNIAELYRFRNSPDFNKWQRANPGQILPLDPEYYTREVPMSQLRQNINRNAATGVGGALGSYAAASASALSGNRLDGLADAVGGNGEMVNTGMDLLRANHPIATTLGDASGQVMFDLAASKVPGLRALPSKRFGQLGMDGLYGAYAGQGEGDTLGGIASNMAGGAVGRSAARVGGAAFRGATSPSAGYLNARDVPLTIGSIARGTESIPGKAIAWTEDRLAGLPIADAIINSARRRGEEGFNMAAFREAGGSGATGAAGVNELAGKVDNAYSFLDPISLPLDATFAGSQAGVRASLPDLPAFGPEVGKGMNVIDKASANGFLPGRDWQSAISDTRGNRASIAGQPFAGKAVDALGDIEANLQGLAARQGPPGTIDNLTAANRQYGQYQTLLSALDNAPGQARGELFSPIRLDTASRQSARGFGGRAGSIAGNRPFYDLTKAGMDVMPNQVPDSGTAGRSLLYAALLPSVLGGSAGAAYGGLSDDTSVAEGAAGGAAIGGIGGTVIPTAVLSAVYSKGGQKLLQKFLLGPRGRAANIAADALQSNKTRKAVTGLGGAAMRDFYLYDPLEQ